MYLQLITENQKLSGFTWYCGSTSHVSTKSSSATASRVPQHKEALIRTTQNVLDVRVNLLRTISEYLQVHLFFPMCFPHKFSVAGINSPNIKFACCKVVHRVIQMEVNHIQSIGPLLDKFKTYEFLPIATNHQPLQTE